MDFYDIRELCLADNAKKSLPLKNGQTSVYLSACISVLLSMNSRLSKDSECVAMHLSDSGLA